MPLYAFDAVDPQGKRHRGREASPTPVVLTRALAERGLVVVRVVEQDDAAPAPARRSVGTGSRRVAVLEVTRALAALLPAGMPLAPAIGAASNLASGELAAILAEVRRRVERGDSLADALAAHDAYFRPLYVGMVRAGERSGDIGGALVRLTEQLEREETLRAKLLSASIYPLILAVAGIVSVTVLVLFVLPRFAELLATAGATLPRSTALLLDLSAAGRSTWPVLVTLALLVSLLALWARESDRARRALSSLLLALPVVRGLRVGALSARFARLVGVLLAGGAPLLTALDDAAESMGDPLARDDTVRIRTRVREGESVAAALRQSRLYPPLLAQLVAVGEESGRLQHFLLKAADIFEDRTDRARQRLVALAEPAMIVVFGGVIGFVALSLLQAVYGVNAGAFR